MQSREAPLAHLVSEPACHRSLSLSFTSPQPPQENGIPYLAPPLPELSPEARGLAEKNPYLQHSHLHPHREGLLLFSLPKTKMAPSAIPVAGEKKEQVDQEEMATVSSLPRGGDLLTLQDRSGDLTGQHGWRRIPPGCGRNDLLSKGLAEKAGIRSSDHGHTALWGRLGVFKELLQGL